MSTGPLPSPMMSDFFECLCKFLLLRMLRLRVVRFVKRGELEARGAFVIHALHLVYGIPDESVESAKSCECHASMVVGLAHKQLWFVAILYGQSETFHSPHTSRSSSSTAQHTPLQSFVGTKPQKDAPPQAAFSSVINKSTVSLHLPTNEPSMSLQ